VHKGRLEAFSDAVIAIVMTIMVLELKVPHGGDVSSLRSLWPAFCSYVLSFVFLGIYWNNHHHLLQAVQHVDGRILWANLHLLFWLSLVPAVTDWMGATHFAPWPVALYGAVMFLAGVAYYVLTHVLIAHHGRDSALARAVGGDLKGQVSVVLYGAAVGLAFVEPRISCALYVVVTVMWLIPDRRIERALGDAASRGAA
jgi:TMEM175 potassium channel family protein